MDSLLLEAHSLLARQEEGEEEGPAPSCDDGNEYDGRMGLRISAIFVILVGSTLGAMFPVFAKRHKSVGVPEWAFFIAKYFGSGVIIATAFIHVSRHFPIWSRLLSALLPQTSFGSLSTSRLRGVPSLTCPSTDLSTHTNGNQLLAPAHEALTNPCLTGPIAEYPWVEGICLMTVFVLFFVEFIAMRYGEKTHSHHSHHHHGGDEESQNVAAAGPTAAAAAATTRDPAHLTDTSRGVANADDDDDESKGATPLQEMPHRGSHIPGTDHLGHSREHRDSEAIAGSEWAKGEHHGRYHDHSHDHDKEGGSKDVLSSAGAATADHHPPTNQGAMPGTIAESYAAQMTAIFILEFGVIFHSIFIGLTLAVAGDEFTTLYVVLVFHQTFEGLGLGSRLAEVPWTSTSTASSSSWRGTATPYLLALGYGVSTPVAIAAGLGVRETYANEARTTLLVNGVLDSVSAGILIYTGLVELMAHEFMFSERMRGERGWVVGAAMACMCLGAGLMALLGNWA
ncbi:ZIP zinc transporter-domain-containing protein [Lineolata rhizophorae]|uniref:ZIP zinc transporter-domain-containing protein n=1 Tax=Lineolata rhizophorae TaxID=578093 RepID=A0A6A6NR49_9PEZI|nr:ZIP zinc transporter-domain-containing protein [Lineolata rhizophorae]